MKFFYFIFLILILSTHPIQSADGNAKPSGDTEMAVASYFPLEPEITTNYISERSNLGFIRVSISIMVRKPLDLLIVEHHAPLIRASIIEILGRQPEHKIKSEEGKESIRRECLVTVNRLIEIETGQQMVLNVLISKYLYN